MGSGAVSNPLSMELRRSLSREEFILFTKERHEKAPSWTAGVRGPAERLIFQSDIFNGEIFTSQNMDWISIETV